MAARRGAASPSRAAVSSASSAKPLITIVGFGRLGGAVASGLHAAGFALEVISPSAKSRGRARKAGLPVCAPGSTPARSALRDAALVLLCVPDSSVGALSESLAPMLGPRTALVHCAGVLPLTVFTRALAAGARPIGSFHPLCAISSPSDPLAGHAVAISTQDRALRKTLEAMASALGLFPIQVPEAKRAAYHAGAVLAAGHAVALLAAACDALRLAGLTEEDAVTALRPLMASALRGVERRGLTAAITGPVRRGDAVVVARHLRALPPDLRRVYRTLGQVALRRLETSLTPEQSAALARALGQRTGAAS